MSRFERPRDPHQTRNTIYIVSLIIVCALFCGMMESISNWVENKNMERYRVRCTYVCSVYPQPNDFTTHTSIAESNRVAVTLA